MCLTEYKRMILKTSDTTTEVATVPTTNDHSDGSWLSTDIYKGEIFINLADGVVQTRDDSGIITIESTDNTIIDITDVSTNYTLILTDKDNLVKNTDSSDITVTIPPNSSVAFPIGSQILVSREGTGEVDMVAGAGVTINSKDGDLAIDSRYSTVSLIQTATDIWLLMGDLKA